MNPNDTINNLAEALKQCSSIAQTMQNALKVITQTPHIRAYLAVMDPMALRQADIASGSPEELSGALNGPLVDLKTMKLIWDALQQFVDNSSEVEGDEKVEREAVSAAMLVERIEVGMVPLMERDDRIFREECARERYKDSLTDH